MCRPVFSLSLLSVFYLSFVLLFQTSPLSLASSFCLSVCFLTLHTPGQVNQVCDGQFSDGYNVPSI